MASGFVDVYVKLPNGKAFSCQHNISDTVKQIAAEVGRREGVPEHRVRLKYQGKTLDKLQTIGYLGICPETILKGEIIFPKEMSIMVTYPGGRCEPMKVISTDTLLTLKNRIQNIEDIVPSSQFLKFSNGATVTGDSNLLCDVGIVEESVIVVSKVTPKANVKTGKWSNSTATTKITEEVDEEKKLEIINTFNSDGKNVEVVFCFDTTGSMYSCLDMVRRKLRETCERLLRDIPRMRIGIMAHGDYCDASTYVVRYIDLTDNVDAVVDFAENVPATGGGDSPEAYEWALRKAQQMDWSEDSAKAFVMIGDDLPHSRSYTDQNLFWKNELDVLAGMGIKVYGVHALNNSNSTPFYQELAERTNGYYLELKDFNLITDMFLAVCYREADTGHLEAFVEEVQRDGRMTENTKLFLDKLEEEKQPMTTRISPNNQRYVADAWWDPSLETPSAKPQYTYLSETDKWKPISSVFLYEGTSTAPCYSSPVWSTTVVPKKSKFRRFFCCSN